MTKLKNALGVYAKNTSGGFAIAFAVTVALLMLGVAFALDYSRMSSTKMRLADLSDAAALAGAKVAEGLSDDERRAVVMDVLLGNHLPDQAPVKTEPPTIIFDDENKLVTVDLTAKIDLLFMDFFGTNNLNLNNKTVASYTPKILNPISIAFALDVSGSMGDNTSDGVQKIEALKTATVSLFDAIEDAAPGGLVTTNVRSGMTAYNTAVVDDYAMSNGWVGLEQEINKLVAEGGTNSTPALQNAYDMLKNDPFKPEGLRQFIIFMTDGDNNQPEWDEDSSAICYQARNEGIELFTVAFAAPDKGQYLLVDCASKNVDENPEHGEPGHEHGKKSEKGKKGKKGKGKGKGKGHAYGHFKNKQDLEDRKLDKVEHYFDAENAEEFEEAFAQIGDLIGENNVRIVE